MFTNELTRDIIIAPNSMPILYSLQWGKFRKNVAEVFIRHIFVTNPVIKPMWKDCTKFEHPVSLLLPTYCCYGRINSALVNTSIPMKFFHDMDCEGSTFTKALTKMFTENATGMIFIWVPNTVIMVSNTFPK